MPPKFSKITYLLEMYKNYLCHFLKFLQMSDLEQDFNKSITARVGTNSAIISVTFGISAEMSPNVFTNFNSCKF